MDIRVLRYFIAAVQTQSITRAAERLHMTQPTLSRQFTDLEKELGHKLFERTNRNLRLTPKGELFYERAKSIVELCEKTVLEIQAKEELTGDIRIAAGETPALRTLARAIKRLQVEAPKVRCHIVSGSEEIVRSELRTGLTDIGVFVGSVDTTGYSSIKLKNKDQWGLLTPKKGIFADRSFIRPKDLSGIPLLCSKQSFDRNEFGGWSGEHLAEIHVVATFTLLYNAFLLAEAGVGHVMALKDIIHLDENSDLMWLPLKPKLMADVSVVWEKERSLSPPVQLLLRFLKEEEEKPL